jgi:hypothetical protein
MAYFFDRSLPLITFWQGGSMPVKVPVKIGEKFSDWTVIDTDLPRNNNNKILIKCECSCGVQKEVLKDHLLSGASKCCRRCSTRKKPQLSIKHRTHGDTLHNIWCSMKSRCYREKDPQYERYGGRGIKINLDWLYSFDQFYDDMISTYVPGLVIDRVDNNLGYSKENCRWATQTENNRNRRDNINITINGRTECITEWARLTGTGYATLKRLYLATKS